MNYRAEIDGLRAIAIIPVLIFHTFPKLIPGGFVGVDIFFVISGYLITTIIKEQCIDNSFSFLNFYKKRIIRIFPALILVLVTSLIIGFFNLLPQDFSLLGKHTLSSSLSLTNLVLISENGYFDISSNLKPLLHLWSLGIEEQFYIIWPIIIYLFCRHKKYTAILLLLFLTSLIYCLYTANSESQTYYSPVARSWELIAGALCCSSKIERNGKFIRQPIISMLGFMMVTASFFIINEKIAYPSAFTLLPVIGTMFIIISVGNQFPNNFLSSKIITYIGKISYPLYLWHWPLIAFINLGVFNYQKFHLSTSFALFTSLIISFILASITYLFIEKKIKSLRHIEWYLITLMSLTAVTALSIYYGNGWAWRYTSAQKAIIDPIDPQWSLNVRDNVCHEDKNRLSYAQRSSADCYEAQRPLVMLWGDSHAGSLYPGLRNEQKHHHFSIGQTTGASRGPFKGINVVADRQYDIALSLIKEKKPDIILMSAFWQYHKAYNFDNPQMALKAIDRTILDIRSLTPGTKLIIVGPVPFWDDDLKKTLMNYWKKVGYDSDLPDYLPTGLNKDFRTWDAEFKSHFIQNRNVTYLSPAEYLCLDNGCLALYGAEKKNMTYIDSSHLSVTGSEFLLSKIINDILKRDK